MDSFDVIIIGSGPGGYVCAIRCAQLGMKTALVEKYKTLGGTCLNVGCIPSKALLDSSEHFYNAANHFEEHGISVGSPKADITKMVARKNKVVEQTTAGIDFLMKKNNIEVFEGLGSFVGEKTIKVSGEKEVELTAKNIIIATGSKPGNLPFVKIDKEKIITSTEALEIKEIPKSLAIIGGGVIGLEMGSIFSRLGTEVTVLEYMDRIASEMDVDVSKDLMRSLKKQGIKFSLSTQVTSVERSGGNVVIKSKNKKGEEVSLETDYCLVAVGRVPFTKGLGLENAGVETDEKGRVKITSNFQTNIEGVYAIGDVVEGAMLAHKAEEEGIYVAEFIAGQKPHINHNLIPGVVYTWPEAAGVGKTEQKLKEEGVEIKVGQFPMRALGRSRASGDIDGMVKIIADAKTDEVLGVHMVGARAADLIIEAVVAMEYRASAEDIARISHPHPTYTEAVKEAALDATGKRALHA